MSGVTLLGIGMVALAGIFVGGAISLRRQGRSWSVALVPVVVAAILLGLSLLLGAFGTRPT